MLSKFWIEVKNQGYACSMERGIRTFWYTHTSVKVTVSQGTPVVLGPSDFPAVLLDGSLMIPLNATHHCKTAPLGGGSGIFQTQIHSLSKVELSLESLDVSVLSSPSCLPFLSSGKWTITSQWRCISCTIHTVLLQLIFCTVSVSFPSPATKPLATLPR